MAKNSIVLTAEPKGTWLSGYLSGSGLYPGMVLEKKAATAPTGGRFTYQARSTTAGSKGAIYVLDADYDQGKRAAGAVLSPGGRAAGDVYTTGDFAPRIYCPVAGEDLLMLVGSVAGTADDVAIGDLFGVNNDGKLKANSSYTSAPFEANETITDPTADYLLWVTYLGNNA